MTLAYIALGSNLSAPLAQVSRALDALAAMPDSRLVAVSAFYRTPALGPQPQADYLNAAAALTTTLDAHSLLHHLQRIEAQQGRIRSGQRWGPRTLDLDIMLFGDQVIQSDELTIPHYDMLNRAFMLLPLLEIAPDLCLPDGRNLRQQLATLDCSAITLWQSETPPGGPQPPCSQPPHSQPSYLQQQGVNHADY